MEDRRKYCREYRINKLRKIVGKIAETINKQIKRNNKKKKRSMGIIKIINKIMRKIARKQ